MGKFNFNPDLFLGQQELEAYQTLLKQDFKLFIERTTLNYGLLMKGVVNSSNKNYLIEASSETDCVKLSTESYAIDSDTNMIVSKPQNDILIPNDNNYWWLKVKFSNNYLQASIEDGLLSILSNGSVRGTRYSLTGKSTSFLTKLRGLPDYPSVIKFFKTDGTTLLNNKEYPVASVVSDTEIVIQGDFIEESNLQYAVVGSFTPLSQPSSVNKYPYRYNAALPFAQVYGTIVEGTTDSSSAPEKIAGKEFYIAAVRNDGDNVFTIVDKRANETYTPIW
jgi:hypothetical protein